MGKATQRKSQKMLALVREGIKAGRLEAAEDSLRLLVNQLVNCSGCVSPVMIPILLTARYESR